jgi:hypothetical protein
MKIGVMPGGESTAVGRSFRLDGLEEANVRT